MPDRARYSPAPGVRWAVEREGIMVINGAQAVEIGYPEAALWDLVVREVPWPRAVGMLSAIARISDVEAAKLAGDTLHEWAASGLVVPREVGCG